MTKPLIKDTPTLAILQAVNDAFASVRRTHPEVPAVAVVLGAGGKRGKQLNLGHFIPNNWAGKDGKHELAVNGEALANGPEDVLDTLLHEAAHALAQQRGIKDTSRQGRFHNKKFKALAEELGLVVEHSKSIGWSLTKLGDATQVLYKPEIAVLRKALKAYRLPDPERETIKKTIRLECGCRGITVPIAFHEAGDILCDLCHELFEEI